MRSSPFPALVAASLLAIWAASALAVWPFGDDTGDEAGRLVLHGNVDIRQVDVAFEVAGRIESIAVEEGARVDQGQPLAVLQAQRYRQGVGRAEGEAAAQRARLAALEAGTRPEEIRRFEARLEAARAEAGQAARHLQRIEGLYRRELVSDEELDAAESALKVARARTDVAQRELELAVAGPREEDIAAARARLNALTAALARARIDLQDTRLRAPQAGVVRERLLEAGDMAGPQQPVFSLALTDPVWIRAYVPETELGRVRPGIPARIHTDSGPAAGYPGWVGYVSPTAEFTPKSVQTEEVRTDLVYQVRIMACNPDGRLRLGMPATVHIAADAQPQRDPGNCNPADDNT